MDRNTVWDNYGKGNIADIRQAYRVAHGGQAYYPTGLTPRGTRRPPRSPSPAITFDHPAGHEGYIPSASSSRGGEPGGAGGSPARQPRMNPDRSTIWRNYSHGHIGNIRDAYKAVNEPAYSAAPSPRQREELPPRSSSSLDYATVAASRRAPSAAPPPPPPPPFGGYRGPSQGSSRYSSRMADVTPANPSAWVYPEPRPGQLAHVRQTSFATGSESDAGGGGGNGNLPPGPGATPSLRGSHESLRSGYASYYGAPRLNEPAVHSPANWSTSNDIYALRARRGPSAAQYVGFSPRTHESVRGSHDSLRSGASTAWQGASGQPAPCYVGASHWQSTMNDSYVQPSSEPGGIMRHGVEGAIASLARIPRRPVSRLPLNTTTGDAYAHPQGQPPVLVPRAFGKAGVYGALLSLPGRANPYYNQDLQQWAGPSPSGHSHSHSHHSHPLSHAHSEPHAYSQPR